MRSILIRRDHTRRTGTRDNAAEPGATIEQVAATRAELERTLCWLHDGPLQALEFIAHAGWRDGADVACLAAVASRAADELRGFIEAHGDPDLHESFFLGLQEIVANANRDAGVRIELVRGPTDDSLPGDSAVALLGALREALTNALKHSKATRIVVYCEEDDGRALVTVNDNGVGSGQTELRGGFGIDHSIVGRMRSIGGWARVAPAPDGGVVVRLRTDGAPST